MAQRARYLAFANARNFKSESIVVISILTFGRQLTFIDVYHLRLRLRFAFFLKPNVHLFVLVSIYVKRARVDVAL